MNEALIKETAQRLIGVVKKHPSLHISTALIWRKTDYKPDGGWDEWAKKLGIKPVSRKKVSKGFCLMFKTDELAVALSRQAESIGLKLEPPAPAAAPRHSLDQVLREFNATTETLHQDVADRLQEIALHLAKQDQALRIIFKQQELLLKELGVAPPAIVN